MKFTVERENLLRPLLQVSAHLGGRSSIPILRNLLLLISNGILSLTCTDLEIEIVARVILSLPYDIGAITVPARKFFSICRSLPAGALIAVQLDGDRMLIRSGRSRFLLSTLPAKDFPTINNWQSLIAFTVPLMTMRYLIDSTQFSMAHQDVRYYLNGMLFETKGKELRTVATDGYRLAVCSVTTSNSLPNYSAIMPRKSVTELMRILNDGDIPLSVHIGSNNICANVGNFILTSKLVDGSFPDFHHVLPKNPDKILKISRNILKLAFTRTAILSNERSHSVRVHVSQNQIKITTNNLELEEAEEIIDAIYTGDEIEICLNATYMLDILNALKCENVRILLTDSISSILVEDAISNSVYYIVMPIRL